MTCLWEVKIFSVATTVEGESQVQKLQAEVAYQDHLVLEETIKDIHAL